MKKLIALFVVAILATSVSFAQAFNAPVTASATFTTKVIAPLSWVIQNDIVLPVVIAGQTREYTTANTCTFELSGEASYDVTITRDIALTTGPVGTSVAYSWDTATPPTALDATGKASMTFTVNSVTAESGTASGERTYTLTVNAAYTGM